MTPATENPLATTDQTLVPMTTATPTSTAATTAMTTTTTTTTAASVRFQCYETFFFVTDTVANKLECFSAANFFQARRRTIVGCSTLPQILTTNFLTRAFSEEQRKFFDI